MKLYLVECQGMNFTVVGAADGLAYVLAEDPYSAYKKLREYLDKNDLGFSSDRQLKTVTLIADDSQCPIPARLFL